MIYPLFFKSIVDINICKISYLSSFLVSKQSIIFDSNFTLELYSYLLREGFFRTVWSN